MIAVPAPSARTTPSSSTLASAGVSDDQVSPTVTSLPSARKVSAKSWSSKPTGSAGSAAVRPLKTMRATPVGTGGAASPIGLLGAPGVPKSPLP